MAKEKEVEVALKPKIYRTGSSVIVVKRIDQYEQNEFVHVKPNTEIELTDAEYASVADLVTLVEPTSGENK